MEKIEIRLTQSQVDKMKDAKGDMTAFGLLAQPILSTRTMRVLVLKPSEYKKADKFFNSFIPKRLRKDI